MKNFTSFIMMNCIVLISSFSCANSEPKMISPVEALAITEKTPEAQALLNYRNGVLASCIKKEVVRTCDSGYVSCRDNAWVVQFLTDECPVRADGRLGLYLLVDGLTGEVLSRYPETDYFQSETFCRDDGDCLQGQIGSTDTCLNFIAAPFYQFSPEKIGGCSCTTGQCIVKSGG